MADGVPGNAVQSTPAEGNGPNFWLISILVITVLFAGYWFFLRTSYEPVLVNLDPQDAAEVAKVLDAKKIPYHLEAQGRTIAVPEAEADRARVELAGSEMPMKGQIGFELFNQSDMGLTEFAQKVNYQRALQGELARTILMLDGIQSVRVHLGLPERSIFRSEKEQPKASVTLILKPGKSLSSAQVSGIQRLVSGAIPEMPLEAVAVLDGTGKLVSPDVPASLPSVSAIGSDAAIASARARLAAVFARNFPSQPIGIGISLRYKAHLSHNAEPEASSSEKADPSSAVAARGNPDFAYAVRLTTDQPLGEAQRAALQASATTELGLDPKNGDSLAFDVGPINAEPVMPQGDPAPERIVAKAESPLEVSPEFSWNALWLAAVCLGLLGLVAAAYHIGRRLRAQRKAELADFANLLRQRLDAEAGA